MAGPICLMAVGNVLTGDDALGPYVLETLKARYEFPESVQLFDAGTPGLDLTLFLEGVDALIVVDALNLKGAPGTVKTYQRDQLVEGALPIVMSPHEPTLREALMRLKLMGKLPTSVLLVGTIPENLKTGIGLSDPVKASVPQVVEHVLAELRRLGAEAAPRLNAAPPRIWWEENLPETATARAMAHRDV